MRYVFAALALFMLLFVAVQYNDPDDHVYSYAVRAVTAERATRTTAHESDTVTSGFGAGGFGQGGFGQ